jgi:hypothetical protein
MIHVRAYITDRDVKAAREPPFGSAWLTFSMIAKVSQNSGSVLWPGPQP